QLQHDWWFFDSRRHTAMTSRFQNLSPDFKMRPTLWHVSLLVLALMFGGGAQLLSADFPVMRIRDVLALSPAELQTNAPVRVRGVVTCVDRDYQLQFLQDDSGGIFLYRATPPVELAPGDLVDFKGVAATGLFAPMLASGSVTLIGKTNLPPARTITLAIVASGAAVGERIMTEGVIERVERHGDHLWMHLADGNERCHLSVASFDGHEKIPLLDSRVRVTGVAGVVFNKQGQMTGFQIFVRRLSEVEVIERPQTDAFAAPIISAAELLRYPGRRVAQHRVHMRGVVTLHWTNRETVFQDVTGSVSIDKGVRADVRPGTEIEVAGFFSNRIGPPQLRNAEVRIIGPAIEPSPLIVALASDELKLPQLVRVMGRVIAWQPPVDGFISAMLDDAGELFTVKLPGRGAPRIAETFPPGATVKVVGVLKPGAVESGSPRFAMLLRSQSDLMLLRAPSKSWRHQSFALVAGGTGLALMVAAAMFALLLRQRRAVAAVVEAQQSAERRLEDVSRQLRHSRQDRERITQELHDNIIQSIFSVGLSVDEARRLAETAPDKVPSRLGVAVESLNAVIRDVRSFISGAEPKGLDGSELKAALKSVLLSSGIDEQERFSIEVDSSAARDLTSLQATELFNIAREAMYNSIRHAHAHRTTVSVVPNGASTQLEVRDDGAGFSPDQVSAGSMGLRNMESRAKRIGAMFEIQSHPGRGTRVTVKVPKPAHASH
ncbi:MAG TPA: sensor histidine kinase, partial [Candidatus Acidoferrum sp.]|nr:sensor histidine kinase [Candidatus Acidoferrum sp.]